MARSRLLLLLVSLVVLVAGLLPATQATAAAWQPKVPPLSTPWTSQVSPANALPEYPRPQLVRDDWLNLNGVWQFAGSGSIDNPPTGQNLAESVLVPYPVESALSGIKRHENNMYYRRTFTVPAAWNGRRVQLNFGAVNWRANVWVNGTPVGSHSGAYDSFSFDITGALHSGDNELIVGVNSPVDAGGQPLGKQRLNPGGIFYTAASGIWQTVWLEPTNQAHITRLDTTPDVAAGVLDLVVQGAGVSGQGMHAVVLAGGQQIASADGAVGAHLRIPIPNARLWSPDDPYLYDLKVSLTGAGGGDNTSGYFGMRSIGKAMVGGVLRPVLNGKFVFNIGTLDQGYWPDGIHTAPTDSALRFDLEQQKALGFNTVRKHIKVEPARWFYWADRLGLMVWQDMPAMRTGMTPSAADRANFEDELHRVVDQLRGITSIVQWIPFNEGWGEYDPARIADLVKGWDPTRLVDNNSGSNCCGFDGGNGDVIDDHIYVGPGETQRPTASRVAVLGEFGGLGLRVSGHEWSPGNGFAYEMAPDTATLNRRFEEVTRHLKALIAGRGLSASIYTQPVDVENEVNGLFTYDRQVLKVDAARVRAVNQDVLAAGRAATVNTIVSLQVTTPGYTNRYLHDQGGLATTEVVNAGSGDALKRESSFWVRPGLADASCVSFESRTAAGQYLRHSDYRVRRDANDGSALFKQDATFCPKPGLSGTGITYESYNLRGSYLRHINSEVYIAKLGGGHAWDNAAGFNEDVSWQQAQAWWRSGADLPVGQNISLQVLTPGLTNRYLRHQDSLGFTEVVDAGSPALLKADATFTVRRGLADGSCYSLESRNFPGHFLRHSSYRIRKDARDGSPLFDQDATFCAQSGLSLEAANLPGYRIRHYYSAVYVAGRDGANPWDTPSTYDADSSWAVVAPWAP